MAANYYEILHVPKDADNKVICEAYKKMALKWHPDKNLEKIDEANQRFKEISQAYQILSDENKRMKYDRSQMDYHDSSDDDDDEFFESFFISPDILFRHFFEHIERNFRSKQYFNNQRDEMHNRRGGNRRGDDRRQKKEESENHFVDECHTRMVNGKQWMTRAAITLSLGDLGH